MQFPPGHFVFLDLETTGSRASLDRITEVGLIEVLDGEVIDQFETLVNPQQAISSFITSLTGINDAMVADAPPFADIAEDLMSRLLGRVLVAHNARFDHSFLKNEFRRVGLEYRTKVLCTVKLSRCLMPELRSHSLDSLITRHGLHVDARHRAMGDADLLVQLMCRWSKLFGGADLETLLRAQLRQASLPPKLSAESLDALPNSPGVYLFYNQGTLLYVGKSVNLRDRVRAHFSGDHASDKELEMCSQISRIEHISTGGDLGARLLEARLIKERSPVYNRQLRKTKTLWHMELAKNAEGYFTVAIKSANGLPERDLSNVVGLFRSRRMAEESLRRICETEQLCHRLTGLEKGRKGACFAHQLRRCAGACVGKEEAPDYNRRLETALGQWRFQAWPYEGAVLVEDGGEYHLVDQWCHLASADSIEDLPLNRRPAKIEYDIYKILLTFISRKDCKVLPLAEALDTAVPQA